jgi:hypothetical protein
MVQPENGHQEFQPKPLQGLPFVDFRQREEYSLNHYTGFKRHPLWSLLPKYTSYLLLSAEDFPINVR